VVAWTAAPEEAPGMGGYIGRFIVQVFLEMIGFYTAKAVLPLLSFGYLRALHSPFVPLHELMRQPVYQRLPGGRIGIKSSVAAIVGLLFWVAVIIAAHFVLGTSP
jgi:hypothetical protein